MLSNKNMNNRNYFIDINDFEGGELFYRKVPRLPESPSQGYCEFSGVFNNSGAAQIAFQNEVPYYFD